MTKPKREPLGDEEIEKLIDEPVRYIHGMRALVSAIRSEPMEQFPMDHHAIDYSFGDIELERRDGKAIFVRDLTDYLKQESFDTPEELIGALQEAFASWKRMDIPFKQMNRPEDQVAS